MSENLALAKMLQFIESYQQQRPHLASIEVVRSLRAYTRPGYASKFWELVAGGNPEFVSGELDNQTVQLAGREIDFAHFMAALSDQAWGGNVFSTLSDGALWLTSKLVTGHGYDSREYTAAIGDTAQPVEIYLDKVGTGRYDAAALQDLLGKFASDQDYDSDILAFVVGRILYQQPQQPLTAAILQADALEFADSVRRYLTQMFGAQFDGSRLQNRASVRQRLCDRIRAYLLIKRDLLRADLLNQTYWRRVRPQLVEQAADHFLQYLQRAVQ
ncbi:MAG: hypothetical protein F6J97_01740 [Leptolyngbya sp. SIO4C1]|nr:hypothetical protein [Leptolyngbya sp. SIO4C1]